MNDTTATGAAIPMISPAAEIQNASETLWSALTADSGCPVLVYDTAGQIIAGNAAAKTLLGLPADEELPGKRLRDLMSPAIAEERLAHASEAIETGGPVVMDGMVAGRMTRGTLRSMPGESAQDVRILETLRPIPVTATKPAGIPAYRAKTDDEGPIGKLTAREREVLVLIGRGLSTAEIAADLGRSTKTVEWHRVSLGTKLGITNRVELARIAIRAGLTDLSEDASGN